MFKNKYLIRLDDACPYMDSKKWQRIEDILDKYGVKPLVGIIPANADRETMIKPENSCFWEKAKSWELKGWEIALHGYDHVCLSEGGMEGLNPMWRKSEFAGLPLKDQRVKIKKGLIILREHGFEPKFFFSPSHTFDENTLIALREETNIRVISDTIAFEPYKREDFTFIPQITGHCVKMVCSGVYTFCFHPNTMKDGDFVKLESFLKLYKIQFVSFTELDLSCYGNKSLLDRLFSWFFFTYRKFRGLK